MPSDAAPAAGWSEFSDAQLISKVRTGETAAYGGLFERHHAAAVGFARRYARNSSDAEDLASEGFANVLSALRTGSGPDAFFRAYLFATIVRLAGRLNNQESRQSLSEDLAHFDVADVDPVVESFESKTVCQAFHSLQERWQAVLWYTEIQRMKPAAVAPLLGLTSNAVSALAVRAREGLRQAYLQQHVSTADDGSECSRHVALLGAYARGGLGSRARVRVQRHLADCPKCAAIYLQLMDIGGGMRGGAVAMAAGAAAASAAGNLSAGGWLGSHAPWVDSQAAWLQNLFSHSLAALRDHAVTVGTAVTAAASAGVVVVAANGGGVLPSEGNVTGGDMGQYSSQPGVPAPDWQAVPTAASTVEARRTQGTPPGASGSATSGPSGSGGATSGSATSEGASSPSATSGGSPSATTTAGTETPYVPSSGTAVPGTGGPSVPSPGQTVPLPVPDPEPSSISPSPSGTDSGGLPDSGTTPETSDGAGYVYAAEVSISRGGGLLAGTDTLEVTLSEAGTQAGTGTGAGSVAVSISYTEDLLNLVGSVRALGWSCTVVSGRDLVCTTAARAGKLPVIAVSRVTAHGRPALKVGVRGDRIAAIGRGA